MTTDLPVGAGNWPRYHIASGVSILWREQTPRIHHDVGRDRSTLTLPPGSRETRTVWGCCTVSTVAERRGRNAQLSAVPQRKERVRDPSPPRSSRKRA